MRVPDATAACWFDGRLVTADQVRLSLDDPTVLAGLGLFETLAVDRGRVLELESHLRRLRFGAERLGLKLPEPRELREAVGAAVGQQGFEHGWIKLILTGRGQPIVFGGEMESRTDCGRSTVVLLPWRRNLRDPLTGLKTLNYAPNLLGMRYARARNAEEGIWLNTRGHLAEGCTSNLFVVQGKKLFTAGEGEGILPGILRSLVLRASRKLGIATHEGRVRLRRLEQASEAFLTSSLRGVCPLVRYEGRPVGSGRPGPVTVRIQAEVHRMRGLA